MMTDDQRIERTHRVGMMTQDGSISEEEAQSYCDRDPATYGVRERTETQERLL